MIYRIIDANLNRLREGLRVVEDAARFLLDNSEIMNLTKEMRHCLSGIIKTFPGGIAALAEARDSAGDVGRETALPAEMKRKNVTDIVTANIKRVQESARVLEEYGKLYSAETGGMAKKLRFQSYELEKKLLPLVDVVPGAAGGKVFEPGLYVITGEEFSQGRSVERVVKDALEGGASVIQMREKTFSGSRLIQAGKEIRKLTREYNAVFIVNDRVDAAFETDADGVHLGQDDLPVDTARKILGPGKLVGVSTHSVEQAVQAERDGADYIGVGPVFETSTKVQEYDQVGIELVREVSKLVSIPRVAIGGIKVHNAKEVLDAGANGIAVITAVVGAEDITKAAEELKNLIDTNT